MLTIRTYIKPSLIHGIGLFAAEDVRAGTVVWKYAPGVDPTYPAADLTHAPEPFRSYLALHAYPDPHNPERIMLDGDDCRYMNHSDAPNVDFGRDADHGYATCDIAAGTELTCNYNRFAPGWYDI